MTLQISPVFRSASYAWKPPSKLKVWEWAEENCRAEPGSAMPGKIRMDNAPWLKEPLDAWGDNSVRDVTVMCSAQSSKTTLAALGMCWSVAEDPGRALWVTADQDMAKEDLRDRKSVV